MEPANPENSKHPAIGLSSRFFFTIILGIILAVAAAPAGQAGSSIISRVSTGWDGIEGNHMSSEPVISADGRYVSFSSYAGNLDPGDGDGYQDVFVKDTATGGTILISTSSTGVKGNNNSMNPSISGDGRYVAFESDADNLVAGDVNAQSDVFVKDIQTGQTRLASASFTGSQGNSTSCNATISANGRYVVFDTMSTNFLLFDLNGATDIFRKDMATGELILISSGSGGSQANGNSNFADVSDDGRYVVFGSRASNLDPADSDTKTDIYLKDAQTGATGLLSRSATGVKGNGSSDVPAISGDGRYAVFYSDSTNLSPADTDTVYDIFMKDTQQGTIWPVSTSSAGIKGNSHSYHPSVSHDGRFVTYYSYASNLDPRDSDSLTDIFVKDNLTGGLGLVSIDHTGAKGNDNSMWQQISSDGRYIALASAASNLVPNDGNSQIDVFITPIGRRSLFTWYDDHYGDNWVLLANPASSGSFGVYDLSIAGTGCALDSYGVLTPGQILTPRYAGVMGGPVSAGSFTGSRALFSQRILWGSGSLEEVTGMDAARLSDRYYWTWYDQQSPGYQNWVLIANPGVNPVYYEVRIAGVLRDSGTIYANQYVTPQFPGVRGGPVEVQAWTDGSKSSPVLVMASQRVLSNGGTAFNEVVGTPAAELSDHYIWTWYDQLSAGAKDWVLVANHNSYPVYYEVKIYGTVYTSGTLVPGQIHTPSFPNLRAGPVEVQAWTDSGKTLAASIIASQRIVWGPSFGETPGYPVASLGSTYHWTWYDQKSAASQNWILVFNPNMYQVYYEIYVAGSMQKAGYISGGQSITPQLSGVMGGPVEVRAWLDGSKAQPRNVFASQRVLWGGYFNEVPGTVLD